jgi:hypothetical protein
VTVGVRGRWEMGTTAEAAIVVARRLSVEWIQRLGGRARHFVGHSSGAHAAQEWSEQRLGPSRPWPPLLLARLATPLEIFLRPQIIGLMNVRPILCGLERVREHEANPVANQAGNSVRTPDGQHREGCR